MLFRTHFMFVVFAVLLLINSVNDFYGKIIFVLCAIFSSALVDIDHAESVIGKNLFFRPLQFFTRHRGMIHSFSFCFLVSLLVALFFPRASLGIFLGYSVHLLADSFTKEGIEPFWPLDYKSKGFILTGGRIEELIFVFMIPIDIILFLYLILR